MAAQDLEKIAKEIRRDVIKMMAQAGSGHSAGSLGMVEIMTALYFKILIHDPKNPNWGKRDRLFLSHGHVCPTLYAAMANVGYFSKNKLKTLRKLDSQLQGHPEREKLPGIEITSGPLGCGLAEAAGYALAARMDGERFRIYCLTSDGEHNEGNHWEAVMFAAKYKLSNLTQIIDRNSIQSDGFTKDVMPLEPLSDKYLAFGWNVIVIDGHNFNQISNAVRQAREVYDQPTVIIAKTVPGKGVPFMENDPYWHGKAPNKKEESQALGELNKK